MPLTAHQDQAATLRRMFPRRQARVLPVIAGKTRDAAGATWLAKLATGFARQGERTLLIDAARVQVAAALGLRARYDLQHALDGDCAPADVLLDAAPGLHVLPAARAFDAASHAGRDAAARRQLLARTLPHLATAADADLLLVLFAPAHAALLPPDCECVLPVVGSSDADSRAPGAGIGRHGAEALRDARVLARRADITGFRLLFLGMDREAAATLASRLGTSAGTFATRLLAGGHALVARDLVHVVRAAAGWRCAPLAAAETEFMA
jgi:hypothetical protein